MQRSHSNQVDEGYSGEETRSQSESEMYHGDLDPATRQMLELLLAMPVEQRRQIIEAGIRSLPSAEKQAVGHYCTNLTHFDPALYLPAELMLGVLSYLSPYDLLIASRVSLAWRQRAQDEKLWRICFAREGWVMDRGKMDAFEEKARLKGRRVAEGGIQRKGSRKRKTEEAFSSEGEAAADRRISGGSLGEEDGMEGVEMAGRSADSAVVLRSVGRSRRPSVASVQPALYPGMDGYQSPSDAFVKLKPGLWRTNTDTPKLSWPYLYKQRARLEKNWETGRAARFQLPLAEHADEGHTECVYAVQHTSRHLVSGSRDRTIRVWDLNTYRLKRTMTGHDASVLCLQFDERPEHDIIVSGGSDSYVIIWRFSTGEILRRMTTAHSESVLNLRFDDRYIVTCSKDKSIKVFSRHALHKSDPLVPTHLLSDECANVVDARGMIAEYSLLTTFIGTQLGGHQAAVNAVQIHGDIIISASGDRNIKSWSIDTGRILRTFTGHTKGIACVQFDGRRIVSGSSDNTVRIFDSQTGAEVACLQNHQSLVRTIQARFGDLNTVTDAELEEEANTISQDFYHALENGMPMPSCGSRRGRNAGSRRPEDITATGTKVPPGGGGGRWAKIISGSYDETVMIWKRDREGAWRVVQTLEMDGAGRGGAARRRVAVAVPAAAGGQGGQAGVQVLGAQQIVQQAAQQTQVLAQQSLQQAQGNIAGLYSAMHHLAAAPGGANPSNLNANTTTTTATTTATGTAATPGPSTLPMIAAAAAAAAAPDQLPGAVAAHNAWLLAQMSNAMANGGVPPAAGNGGNDLLAPLQQLQRGFGPLVLQHAMLTQQNQARALQGAQLGLQGMQGVQQNQQQAQAQAQAQQYPGQNFAPGASGSTLGPLLHNPPLLDQHPQPAPQPAPQQPQPQPQPPSQSTLGPLLHNPLPLPTANTAPQPIAAVAAAPQPQHHHRESNRVFKLQFDTRRLIACSQNRVIVGWDFADGERELERVGGWGVETA
ncbi:hypothetical protein LTR78_004150 [Recurvomyces mirabilis]|uniref:F-box domain-containing protein n=1 Tax=Recurvomyces mirabilis TaxID=574656 RepID=A0AAE1C2S8_9PEZI|nr:hypothetical protein LTR78_004150 [Recurvomyces mirabilis]KAK5153679.1 hypothetical protein LTS14_007373 [Recurvomyces mirabilis]